MKDERVEEIREVIWCEPWKDNQLFPDLLVRVFNELAHLATDTRCALRPIEEANPRLIWPEVVAEWAAELLEVLDLRARSGIPFDEPPYDDQPPTNPEDL